MKQYRFRLDRLLTIRKYRELEWELKLAAATGECVRLANEIQEMDGERRSTLAQRYRGGGLDMDYLAAAELYMRKIDARTAADRSALVERERERDEVRAGYLEASKERKVLDRLRDRRAAADRREQLIEEIGEVDDITGSVAAWRAFRE